MPMDIKSPPTPEKKAPEPKNVEMDTKPGTLTLSSLDLLSFAKQIALGMVSNGMTVKKKGRG